MRIKKALGVALALLIVGVSVGIIPVARLMNPSVVEATVANPLTLLVGGAVKGPLRTLNGSDYQPMQGELTFWNSTIAKSNQPISVAGTLSHLQVEVTVAPENGAGTQSWVFTLMLNNNPSALTVTISEGATTGFDEAHSVAVVPGDYVAYRCTASGTPVGTAYEKHSLIFDSTDPDESMLLGGGYAHTSATAYVSFQGCVSGGGLPEDSANVVMPAAGTLSDLYVCMEADPGGAPDAYAYTVRVNGGTPADSLTTTIVADSTTGNDTAHTVSVVAGDRICIMVERVDTPTVISLAHCSVKFTPTTSGVSVVLGSSGTNQATIGSTRYWTATGGYLGSSWSATETLRQHGGQSGFQISDFYVWLGTGTSTQPYAISVRVNAGGVGLDCTIPAGQRSANDTTGTFQLSDYDDIAIACTPTVGGTARDVHWGFLVTTLVPPPTVTTSAATDVEEESATLNGDITVTEADCSVRGFQYDTNSGAPYASDWHEDGTFGVASFTHALSGLEEGQIYYYRAYATNVGGTSYGAEQKFLCKPDEPSSFDVVWENCTALRMTWVNGDGYDVVSIRALEGAYPAANRTDGAEVYNGVLATFTHTPLDTGDHWYYRIWSYCSADGLNQYSDAYGQDNEVVQCPPDPLENFRITTITATSISIAWSRPEDTASAIVRYNSYTTGLQWPDSPSSGTPAYTGAVLYCVVDSLTPGMTYFFSGWGYDGVILTSDPDYAVATATTLAGGAATDYPDDPGSFDAPGITGLVNAPGYSLMYLIASRSGMPVNNFFQLSFLVVLSGLVIGVAVKTRSTLATVLFSLACLGAGYGMDIVPFALLMLVGGIGSMIAYMRGGQPSA
jgi:hypothetical protein